MSNDEYIAKYAYFDGDNVGNTIKNLLNNGRYKEATHLSKSIKIAIFNIENFLVSLEDIDIIIAGGDDLLIKYNAIKYNFTFLQKIISIFNMYTGLSMSCGVGVNVTQAIGNLIFVKQDKKGLIKFSMDMLSNEDEFMKPSKLYIFTTSNIPDPYINVIAHCIANYKQICQTSLIGIIEDKGKQSLKQDELNRLKENINNQLDSLSNGKYRKKKGKDWEEVDIHVEVAERRRYSELKDIPIDLKVFYYDDLDKELSNIFSERDSFLHIFDVTALLKNYLVDIYSILRFKNISTIYSFELFNQRFYDQRDLIHNLTYKKTYDFICLSETLYTKDKVVVDESSIVNEVDFNKLQSEIEILKDSRDKLEEKIANDFASLCCLVYFLMLLPLFIWICWSIAQPEGWNRIEPITFIITFGLFILNYLLQSVFTGKFPSLDPRELFNALSKWKKKNLHKSR